MGDDILVHRYGSHDVVTQCLFFLIGFTFASKIPGRICPWTISRSFKNQCLERFVFYVLISYTTGLILPSYCSILYMNLRSLKECSHVGYFHWIYTQFYFQFWTGDVVLKDLKLKAEALNSLRLPVTVKAGFVGTITLKVLIVILLFYWLVFDY